MEGDTVMAKRFEPACAIGVEGVDKEMGEELYAEKHPPVPLRHRRPGPDACGQPRQQGRHDEDE
jgi:hypothetical protein